MTTATLLFPPVAPVHEAQLGTSCAACFASIEGPSDTGLYCAHCACHRCGEDATGSASEAGYCEHCAATLEVELVGFFG